jgi:hypothetical protein
MGEVLRHIAANHPELLRHPIESVPANAGFHTVSNLPHTQQ